MRKRTKAKNRGNRVGLWATAALFVLMLAILVVGVVNLSGGADERGVESAQNALRRAAVMCYATEGFYPPNLDYIRQNYGVDVDQNTYVVVYEVQGASVMPRIQVVKR